MLLEAGEITESQLSEALDYHRSHGVRLGQALVDLGFITEDKKTQFLAEQLRLEVVNLKEIEVDTEVLNLFDKNELKDMGFIPFERTDISLRVVVLDPFNINLDDFIRRRAKLSPEYVLAKDSEIEAWLDSYLGFSNFEQALIDDKEVLVLGEKYDLTADEDSPVIEAVNKLLTDAVKMRASDIHIMPTEDTVNVRYRIDGVLQHILNFHIAARDRLVVRIKTMAGMDIAERRRPQGGNIKATIDGTPLDMRVSTLPSIYGEKITIRLLDTSDMSFELEDLGLVGENLEKFKRVIRNPYGILLITGPTASGKTTTLYSIIKELNDVSKNIVTLEDPVEYLMSGVTQVKVNPKAGLTFASGFREILRQDPDIILVGEIRDEETAKIATQASNTGHLVLSTMHTNNSTSSIKRLLDMGLEPYMIADSLLGVMSQRLVRRICLKCKEEYYLPKDDSDRKLFGFARDEEIKLYRGRGCSACNNTGYYGMIALHELLVVDDDIRELLHRSVNSSELRDYAVSKGLKTLLDDGLSKAYSGITTLDELKRMLVI